MADKKDLASYTRLDPDHEKTIKIVDASKKEVKKIKQNVALIADNDDASVSTLMNFKAPVGGDSKDIVTVLNSGEEYWVEIRLPDAFIGKDGSALSANPNVKVDEGAIKLKIDPSKTKNPIDIKNGDKGRSQRNPDLADDQLIVTITGEDGVKYQITVDSTSVDMKIDDQEYGYSISKEDDQCIDAEMNTKAVEGMLSEKSNVFVTAKNVNEIPRYLLGMYYATIESNQIKTFGKRFSIIKASFKEAGGNEFCMLYDNTAAKMYLFHDGKLLETEGFSFQYEQKGGKIVPYLVLSGKGNNSYYKFAMGELEQDETGKVSINGKGNVEATNSNLFKFMKGFEFQNLEPSIETQKFTVGDRSFTLADGRKFTDYKFAIKSKMQTHELEEAPEKVAESTVKDEAGEKLEKGDTDGNKPDGKKPKDEKPKDDEKDLEKENSDKGSKETEERRTVKPPFEKKAIEAFGNSMAIIGLMMLLAFLIPGVGVFAAIIGGALAATGIGAVLLAEKLVFDPYEVTKRRLNEFEDHQAAEFLEAEDDLESLISNSNEAANEVERISNISPIEGGNALAHDFMDVYEKNGLAFTQDGDFEARKTFLNNYESRLNAISGLDEAEREIEIADFISTNYGPDLDDKRRQTLTDLFKSGNKTELLKQANLPTQTRYQRLLSRDGLNERETIVNEINDINNPANASRRDKLIDEFMFVHFDGAISDDDKTIVKSMFEDGRKNELVEFVDKVKILNNAQREETEKLDLQKSALGHKTNDEIGRILGYSKLSSERRKALVERYGVTILKHLAIDDLTHEKVNEILGDIPESDREDIYKIFVDKASDIQRDAKEIIDVAEKHKQTQTNIEDLDAYAKAMVSINEAGCTTDTTLAEATTDFNRRYTAECLVRTSGAKNAEWLRDEDQYITTPTPLNNIQNIIGNAVTEMITHDQEKLVEQFKVLDEAANTLGFSRDLGEMNYQYSVDNTAPNPQAKFDNPRQISKEHSGGIYSIGHVQYELLGNLVKAEIEKIDAEYDFADKFSSVTRKDGSPIENPDQLLERRKTLQEAQKAYHFISGNRYNFHDSTKVHGKITKSELITQTTTEILKEADVKKSDFTSESGKYHKAYAIALDTMNGAGEFDDKQKQALAMVYAFATVTDIEQEDEQNVILNHEGLTDEEARIMLQTSNAQREICSKMMEFVRLLQNGKKDISNINYAIRSAAYKKYCEDTLHIDMTDSTGLEKSADTLKKSCEVRAKQEEIINQFSEEKQSAIREKRGEDLTRNGFVSDLKDAVGKEKIDDGQPAFEDLVDEHSYVGGGADILYRTVVSQQIEPLKKLNERRSQTKLSSFASQNGKGFVKGQFDYHVTNDRGNENKKYDNVIDIVGYLVVRFGLDREKLVAEIVKMKQKDQTITNNDLVKGLCNKFGISVDENEIRAIDEKLYNTLYNGGPVVLSEPEQKRIQLTIQNLELQELEIYLKKFDKYVEQHDYTKLLELCKDDKLKELLKTMSNHFEDVYTLQGIKKDMLNLESIQKLLENDSFVGKSDKEKLEMFDNLLKTIQSVSEGNRIFGILRYDLDKKIDANKRRLTQLSGASAEKVIEAEDQYNKINEELMMLQTVYKKLTDLQESKGYSPEQINSLLNNFAIGNFHSIIAELPELSEILSASWVNQFVTQAFSGYKENAAKVRKVFENILKKQSELWTKSKNTMDNAYQMSLKELSPRDRERAEHEYEKMLTNIGDIHHIISVELSNEQARKTHKKQIEITEQAFEKEYPSKEDDKDKESDEDEASDEG